MPLIRLSHGNSRKRYLILWFGAAGTTVKDGPVVLIDNVRKRIKTIDEVFANFKLFSVATMLYVTASLLVSPLQPLGCFKARFSVGLIAMPRKHCNLLLLKQKRLVELWHAEAIVTDLKGSILQMSKKCCRNFKAHNRKTVTSNEQYRTI